MMFFLASPSLFRVSINISSDPIFIVLVLVFLLVEHDFLQKRTIQSASLFGLIAALVPLQRYVGIIVIATGAASIFYHMRKDLKNAFRFTMLFSLFSATPISIWLVRNYVNTQVLFGTHRNTNLFLYLAENISDSALKISRWFIPASILPPGSAQFFGIIGSLVILTFFFVMRSGRQAKVKTHILHHINFYLMIISFYTVIAVMSRPWEHSYVLDDRLWLPLLPLLFVLLVLIFESGFLMDRLPSTKTDVFIMVLFGVWLFFPMNSMLKTISQIRNENQVITYNLYNSPDLKNSSITKYLQEEDIPENMTIYSNFHGAVYFYTKRQAESPPYNYLPKSLYDDWPKPSPALLVWYEPNFRKDIYQPNELTEFARISPQYVSEEGGVYLIEAIQSNEDR